MFGFARRRAVQTAVDNIRPIIGIVQHIYGIPPRFWLEPYVLGFISALTSFHIHSSTGGKLSTEEKGRALADVLTQLSNQNGFAIGQEATKHAFNRDPLYVEGINNGTTAALYSVGLLGNEETNPHVITAKRMAMAMNKSAERSAILGMLIHNLFVERVCRDFGLGRHDDENG